MEDLQSSEVSWGGGVKEEAGTCGLFEVAKDLDGGDWERRQLRFSRSKGLGLTELVEVVVEARRSLIRREVGVPRWGSKQSARVLPRIKMRRVESSSTKACTRCSCRTTRASTAPRCAPTCQTLWEAPSCWQRKAGAMPPAVVLGNHTARSYQLLLVPSPRMAPCTS